jgi:glycosyltransferase involved in cell wall biosynthesis
MNKGFSILVCCFNSEKRIEQTLISLSKLDYFEAYPIEIVIVDNNSKDQTIKKINAIWSCLNSTIPLRIINEFEQGLTNARISGINNAKYEYLIFCDDDNWLFPDYLDVMFQNFKNEDCHIVGGVGIAKPQVEFPNWFSEYQGFGYAVGNLNRKPGKGQFVYGAGMGIRKDIALNYAMKNHLLSDRIGTKITSGGDTEICHIVGKENIYFDENLKFYHFLPSNRLTWEYYKKLNASFGTAHSYLIYYYLAKESKLKALFLLLTKFYHSFNFVIYNSLKQKNQRNEIEFLFNYHFVKGTLFNLVRFRELYSKAKFNLESVDS